MGTSPCVGHNLPPLNKAGLVQLSNGDKSPPSPNVPSGLVLFVQCTNQLLTLNTILLSGALTAIIELISFNFVKSCCWQEAAGHRGLGSPGQRTVMSGSITLTLTTETYTLLHNSIFSHLQHGSHCYFTRLNLKKWGLSNFVF